jgi:phosphotransferase system HPr (HPr) family protein
MKKLNIVIPVEEGLHARPAHLFCITANKYKSALMVRNVTTDSTPVSAKSILMILSLGVMHQHEIEILATGPDEADAIASFKELIENRFPG